MGDPQEGVSSSLVDILESFHSNMYSSVIIDDASLEEIDVTNGLRQGCTMAPVFFNLFACVVVER